MALVALALALWVVLAVALLTALSRHSPARADPVERLERAGVVPAPPVLLAEGRERPEPFEPGSVRRFGHLEPPLSA